ncbi:hypothetical protein Misp01_23050 [Microtetraspora sp. NBRC 13810]|uniref:GAF domain-containing protein n=1 Tax=Microtetraspora sp. NBRC 13810 TaxID=3030990 RepID=UPI0024A037FA|nr:GAF domain-containing protein [Microtetraspora sp. NBRC 13810]GLW07175.1 hypothetical protein Misp01_23050 [Microtetraspora sp. NBRC 13810]
MLESLRESTRANQEQDWLKTNLARISGLMQGHRDLAVVAELVMNELAPLVSAQNGTFLLAEEYAGKVELRVVGCYGHLETSRRYAFGESLVGQAALAKRTILVEDIASGYLTVSSSLGQAGPVNLIILPIVVEDQVLGVIELASLGRYSKVHRDFLEQLVETIGVNVNTIVANARTDALLAESQRLATELQVGQEELQRSNAELEEKAELLAQNPTRNLTPKQVEYANVIHSAGTDLLQLINDILDLSKIEAGKMDISPEPLPLRQLLDYVEANFRPLTTEKGLEFGITVAADVPAVLLTDEQRARAGRRSRPARAAGARPPLAQAVRKSAAASCGIPRSSTMQW